MCIPEYRTPNSKKGNLDCGLSLTASNLHKGTSSAPLFAAIEEESARRIRNSEGPALVYLSVSIPLAFRPCVLHQKLINLQMLTYLTERARNEQ